MDWKTSGVEARVLLGVVVAESLALSGAFPFRKDDHGPPAGVRVRGYDAFRNSSTCNSSNVVIGRGAVGSAATIRKDHTAGCAVDTASCGVYGGAGGVLA